MDLITRFINYTKFDTQSNEDSQTVPSSLEKQLVFASFLKAELENEGLEDVEMDDKGSVYAYVSSFKSTPSLKNADKFTKASNSAVDYSGAKDITSTLQAYVPQQVELVALKGKLSSKKIELYHAEGEEPTVRDSVVVELLNVHSSLKMSELDGWLVNAKG